MFPKLLLGFALLVAIQARASQRPRDPCACVRHVVGADQLEAEIKTTQPEYCNNQDCEYVIEKGNPGTAIKLHFEHFNTEHTHDYLEINQTFEGNSYRMDRFTGDVESGTELVSAENHGFSLKFHSDGSATGSGFIIRVTRFDVDLNSDENCDCPPIQYDADNQLRAITSPNSNSGKYCKDITCYYRLTAQEPYSVELTLDSIEMHQDDSVSIYEAENKIIQEHLRLTEWTGSNMDDISLPKVVSKSHGLILVFKSFNFDAGRGTGFTAHYKQTTSPCHCGQEIINVQPGESGILTSPGYPLSYCDNLDCTYEFNTHDNNAIQYQINFFETEYGSDSLVINDLSQGTKQTLQRYSGETISHADISRPFTTSHASSLHFVTDGSVIMRGFNLTYRSIPQPSNCRCPGPNEFSSETGTLALTQETGCKAIDCFYTLNMPEGKKRVALEFSVQAPAPHGKLIIYTNQYYTDNYEEHDSYTTAENREIVIDSSESVRLHYHSEATEDVPPNSGFSLKFEWMEECPCGDTDLRAETIPKSLSSPGFPTAYCNEMQCKYEIRAPEGHRVVMEIQEFKTEADADFLFVLEGEETNSEIIEEYSGWGAHPSLVRTEGQLMTLVFETDTSVVQKGFSVKYRAESLIPTTTTSATSSTSTSTSTTTSSSATSTTTTATTTSSSSSTTKKTTGEPMNTSEPSGSSGLWIAAVVIVLLVVAAVTATVAYLYGSGRLMTFRLGRKLKVQGFENCNYSGNTDRIVLVNDELI